MTDSPPDQRDWRETLTLPQTDFPMKAGLPKREPEIFAHWQKIDLYKKMREEAKGREKFILHDGPPYANGDIHIGHAMQKTLKDVVCRSQQMMGKDAPFVPGWDCHGLPIEWKIEEEYRNEGKSKDEIPPAKFRARCRKFAERWVKIQRDQFKRLGIVADWDNPYLTMDFESEARIVEEFHKFAMSGALYLGLTPVMWSVVEKTALAEAEVEYKEIESTTTFVKFPVVSATDTDEAIVKKALGSSVVIWTTTPWTLTGNRGIAFNENLSYGIYEANGENLILCDALAEHVMQATEIKGCKRICDIPNPATLVCHHPFHNDGYEFDVRLYHANFVTDETGTGFVHVAPGYGLDDFVLMHPFLTQGEIAKGSDKEFSSLPRAVDEAGVFPPDIPLLAGRYLFNANGEEGDANPTVIDELKKRGALLAQGKLRHQYPHSWRSKTPLIFRATPQWFIYLKELNRGSVREVVDKNFLRTRNTAIEAISTVKWHPEAGRNRIHSMVETRPDWLVSRQRAWGVPLAIFQHKQDNKILNDPLVNENITEAIRERGAEAWFDTDPQEFLGEKYNAEDFERVDDILDVWFDSGVTHAFVLRDQERYPDLQFPADLYLEGSDQHRGWFQSSLLTACATEGKAPYKAVVTHGFVMDEQGRKMSKSLGNVVDPQRVIDQSGADIIRLWVMSADYTEDMRVGAEILKATTDSYRKMRNTLRFLLGNLGDYTPPEKMPEAMPELERYILHRLAVLDEEVRAGYVSYNFRKVFQSLFNFMTLDLSAFYFDIRKDALYCDAPSSDTRQACLYVLDRIFEGLTAWLAPMLVFTMEEVWQSRYGASDNSVHLRQFPAVPAGWRDDALAEKWEKLRMIRRVVTGALELERRDKRIGSSLEAAPHVHVTNAELKEATKDVDMAELCITSDIAVTGSAPPADAFVLDDVAGVAVVPALAKGQKCQRSWKISPDVGSVAGFPDLSPRDAEAVMEYDKGVG